MKQRNFYKTLIIVLFTITFINDSIFGQVAPDQIKFVRQGVTRLIFDEDQAIVLASLEPGMIVGLSVMHPITNYGEELSKVNIKGN